MKYSVSDSINLDDELIDFLILSLIVYHGQINRRVINCRVICDARELPSRSFQAEEYVRRNARDRFLGRTVHVMRRDFNIVGNTIFQRSCRDSM